MKKKISYNEHKKFEDDNILVFGKPFNLVSIYDDRVYDRSDADFMNTSMRSYFKERLTELQYDWLSGNVLGSPLYTTTFIFPKNGILGASPFDITRFEKRREDDYFVLTPTQVAAYLIKFKCGEGILENLKNWFNFKYEILYFYNVYGPKQISVGNMATVIGIFENQYKNNKPLTVVKPGNQIRDFTHVKDIIQGTILAAYKAKNDEFHIGSGKNYSILEIAKLFNHEYVLVPERKGERFYSLAKNSKAKRVLGYKPKYELKKYIHEFKKQFK